VLALGDNYLIPKVLIHSERYKNLQTDAAVLYAVLFDKSIVSDEDDVALVGDDGRKLFITCPVSEIISGLDFVDKRADILLRELDSEGLIKVVGQGEGNSRGIIVFPVSDGSGCKASEGIDLPIPEETDHPPCEGTECPPSEEIDNPASEEIDSPASEVIERRAVSSVKLRYIGSPVVAESVPEFVPDEYISLHERQTHVSSSSDDAACAPHPVSNRIIALQGACNNEFSPSDVRELWISMQDVIDEARWDDLDFLSGWLRAMYSEMHSRVAGGDKFVRIALLQELISEK